MTQLPSLGRNALRPWSAILCSSFQLKKETQAVRRTRSWRQDQASVSAFPDNSGELADQIGSARSVRIAPHTADTPEPGY